MHNNSVENGSDLQQIRTTISTLHERGALIELCAIGDRGVTSGYYDDHDALAREAKRLSDSGIYHGVYITVNPVKRDVPKRKGFANNRMYDHVASRTRDEDIKQRRWFVLDVDPVREPQTSATAWQKGAAHWCLSQTMGVLRREHGFPEPIRADSGNGYYAIYPVNEPNDYETRELFGRATRALSAAFSIAPQVEGEIVKVAVIDEVTFNAARLIKLFGTIARKGPNTAETPHRLSWLGAVPKNLRVVTRAKLEELVGAFGGPENKYKGKNAGAITAAKVEEFLSWAGIRFEPAVKELDGSHKWIIDACPFDAQHRNSPALFLHSDGSVGYHCFHKSCENKGWKEFHAAMEKKKGEKFDFFAAGEYWESDDGIFYRTTVRGGVEVNKKLTNFNARIIADIEEDDGVNCRHEMQIQATVRERKTTVVIPASEYKAMNWVLEKLGGEAVVYAGQGITDHARTAIQVLSSNVDRRRLYLHTGWRKIDDARRVYLHGRGAIGAKGLDTSVGVKLPPSLKPFRLPEPPTGNRLKKAVRASLRLLDVGPHSRTVPVYAALWRGALAACDFSLHMTGQTGTFKSSFNALALQHFGKGFNRHRFPANWMDTENHIAQLQFVLKDAPIGIDDFLLRGGQSQIASMHAKADRVFRGQGNTAGRGRMMRDGVTLRDPAPPRGVTLSTGEGLPRGESLQARVWNLDVSPRDIDFEKLKACQEDSGDGLYEEAMSAYLQWVAPQYDAVSKSLRVRAVKYCEEAARDGQHAHTPEIVANLMSGMDFFLKFAGEIKALSADEATKIRSDAWQSLLRAAAAQTRGLATEDPARRFLDLIAAAIRRGDAHLGRAATGSPLKEEKGKLIGWVSDDEKEIFLMLDSAFAAAQELARQQQEPFTLRMKTLGNRLRDRKLLAEFGTHRNTVQKKIGGAYLWVLCVRKNDVLPSCDDEDEE